jgi:hypothetical protein
VSPLAGFWPAELPLFFNLGQGPPCKYFQDSRGLDANLKLLFVLKNSKLVNSSTYHRKIGKNVNSNVLSFL